ncbi:tail protein X [Zooshikella sp. RANM57]|uniref:tail protein X n=1 Tax=Zooshikella sp. RANM57 TaxID=3425863 RepID=UPI003D6E0872
MNYRTKDGDVVDAICCQLYGRSDVAPDVYDLNPGLSSYGPVLPAGIMLRLPDVTKTKKRVLSKVSLFD